eukprot:5214065-Lingulodinium_polyedra.AAC.1
MPARQTAHSLAVLKVARAYAASPFNPLEDDGDWIVLLPLPIAGRRGGGRHFRDCFCRNCN